MKGALVDLEGLVALINNEHRACEQAVVSTVNHAIAAGEMLLEAKSKAGHGNWLTWLEDNFEGSERIAQTYMRLARNKGEINPQHASDSSIRGALREMSASSEMPRKRLTREEARKLTDEVKGKLIPENIGALKEVVLALREVRDERLYRPEYPTFESYCRDRWNKDPAFVEEMFDVVELMEATT